MSKLWVPPRVSRQFEEERMAHVAKVAMLTVYQDEMRAFNVELQQIDPYLELVKAKETVEPGSALRPGFWHIIRHNPGAPVSVMKVEGPDGEYIEPRDNITAIWSMLTEWMDLQNPAVEFRRRQREHEATLAAERMEAREREDHNAETVDRIKAALCTSVSMTKARPWHQNQFGVRGSGPKAKGA